ncbi:hypothetical protein SKAU_G00230280 [Synaphobranchus kaupii]|uniref:Uncharacterized protein n=1 Tax=Synaphobranchus kaupii TaxID=118154 RepID=A0A9Q1ISX2_SYNKA|nr:hypothetical protein SKAU_G00230280 [Synaphobranchus kaupii]
MPLPSVECLITSRICPAPCPAHLQISTGADQTVCPSSQPRTVRLSLSQKPQTASDREPPLACVDAEFWVVTTQDTSDRVMVPRGRASVPSASLWDLHMTGIKINCASSSRGQTRAYNWGLNKPSDPLTPHTCSKAPSCMQVLNSIPEKWKGSKLSRLTDSVQLLLEEE